ncbi:-binding protein 1 [Phaffia rhodozyma]|uniref:-binding protein 1 n=1 Tax=Phaffia rhodozyma TaxID=264483 RepID=A0A0F7SP19_PHARH|nr:-binding protein 1 [Phaffia rhodozyma]
MPFQKTFQLARKAKGAHLVTDEVVRALGDGLKDVKIGMLFLFIKHTSAGLTLNENYDPDVRSDMTMALDKLVPESLPWQHVDEGPDDSVSHTKTTLVGNTISIPISNGKLQLGTWQGIYLMEFRHLSHVRTVVATVL